jgi:transposase
MDKREYWRSGLELSTGEGLVVWNARKKAEKDGDLKGARRLRAIHLVGISHYTQKTVGEILEVSENAVTRWVMTFQQEGVTGLRTRKPPGPKSRLTEAQKKKLERLVRKGPEACGFDTGVWDAKLVGELVKREFGVEYHPTSIRRLLKDLGFSLQYPKKVLGGANAESQRRWVKKVYPSVKKKPRRMAGSSSSRTKSSSSKKEQSIVPGHRSEKVLK